MHTIEMNPVREWNEELPVELVLLPRGTRSLNSVLPEDRLVVCGYNEGGYNRTCIDLLDLIGWLKKHKPELLT